MKPTFCYPMFLAALSLSPCYAASRHEQVILSAGERRDNFEVKNAKGSVSIFSQYIDRDNTDVHLSIMYRGLSRVVFDQRFYMQLKSAYSLKLQEDGNLVIVRHGNRGTNGREIGNVWVLGSSGPPDCELVLEDDGSVFIRSKSTKEVFWRSYERK